MAEEKITKSDTEWKKELDPVQYQVLRQHGTERAFTSPLNDEKRKGEFLCAGCGEKLFDSATKYESGSGWPSFYAAQPGAVGTTVEFNPRGSFAGVADMTGGGPFNLTAGQWT